MNRDYRLDILRLLATVFIVSAHVSTNIVARSDFQGGYTWWLAYLTYSLSIPATPLFFILSGYLFSLKIPTFTHTLASILLRFLIPWSFFTLLGTLIYNALEPRISWNHFLNLLVFGGGTHLYFLLGLSIHHLLTSVFYRFFLIRSQTWCRNFTWLLLFLTPTLSLIAFVLNLQIYLYHQAFYWFLSYCYFIFGYFLNTLFPTKLKLSIRFLILIPCLHLITYTLIHTFSEFTHQSLGSYLFNYFSILPQILSLIYFRLFLSLPVKLSIKPAISALITSLSKHSYGVYLSHMIILESLLQLTPLSPYNSHLPLIFTYLSTLAITLFVSLTISIIFNRLPFFRLFTGSQSTHN